MNWFRKLLGIKTSIEKKKIKLADLQEKAFQAQRNGDLRLAGKYYHEAEILETEIVESVAKENENIEGD